MKKLIAIQETDLNTHNDAIAKLAMETITAKQIPHLTQIKERFLSQLGLEQKLRLKNGDPYTTLFNREELATYTQSFSLLHGIFLFRIQNKELIPIISHTLEGIDRPGEIDRHPSDYETYVWKNTPPETPHRAQSMTKSISSLILGAALQHTDMPYDAIHQPLSAFIPRSELDSALGLSELDKQKIQRNLETITLYDILNMSSGIVVTPPVNLYDSPLPPWTHSLLGERMHPHKYSYADGDSNILGKVIECITGQPTIKFAREHFFEPLGINPKAKYWTSSESNSNPFFCCSGGLSLSALDLAKIGQFIMNEGRQETGETLLNLQEWVSHLKTIAIDFEKEKHASDSKLRPDANLVLFKGYSQLWWHFETIETKHNDKPIKCLMCAGIGGQKLFIAPELKLIFITQGGFYNVNATTHPEESIMLYSQSRRLFESLLKPYCNTK